MPMRRVVKMWWCLVLSTFCVVALLLMGAPACILLPFIMGVLISVGGLMYEGHRRAVKTVAARARAEAQVNLPPASAPPMESRNNTRMRMPESRYE